MSSVDDLGLHFGLLALLHLGDASCDNLVKLRRAQRAIVHAQIREVRFARSEGFSWTAIACALGISEDLARERFELRPLW